MAVVEAFEKHRNLVDELLRDVARYNPAADRDVITRAFRYAAEAHEGQTRKSGEDFIHHPVAVARICAELRLDAQTITAALLHDVLEDTERDVDELRIEFGEDVVHLVAGVT